MAAPSSRHNGWLWNEASSRLECYVRGTLVMYVDDAVADLTLVVNGISGLSASNVSFNDDVLMTFGTDDDVVMLNRSSTLTAGSELANVIVGTSVLAEIPANSLIVSNITEDGDIVFAARTGADSLEYLRIDASAKELVINGASNDINFRVESDGDTDAIFVDAGNGRVGILNGSPAVALDVGGAITASNIVSADEWQTTGGGTITQQTSKAEGFTLDKTTGVITMDNASLAAAAEVVSVFTNSTINATSVVVVSHAASGAGNAEDYLITAGEVQSGSCEITLSNISTGSTTDAIAINFVVIGGASS